MYVINRENFADEMDKLGVENFVETPVWEKNYTTTEERYYNAVKALPVPKAFEEIKISLRMLRKERSSTDDKELKELYKWAVIESFVIEPYSKVLQCPTFEIMNYAFNELKDKDYDWNVYGYEKLSLTKTDIKAMVEYWGEPKKHSTANKEFSKLYKETEQKLLQQRKSIYDILF